MKLKKNHPDESEMFRAAMTDVRRLKPGNRTEHRPSRPGALPLQRQRDEKSVMEELLAAGADPADMETGEELLYLRPGHSPRLLRRLRRGHFSVADSIDLHHLSESTARDVLVQFLAEAISSKHGCVRVVHGKGLRSRGLPKLKIMTRSVLRKHPSVIAFASCRPVDGGTGAVLVLLRQPPVAR